MFSADPIVIWSAPIAVMLFATTAPVPFMFRPPVV